MMKLLRTLLKMQLGLVPPSELQQRRLLELNKRDGAVLPYNATV